MRDVRRSFVGLAVSAAVGGLVLALIFVFARRQDPPLTEFLGDYAEAAFYFFCYGSVFALLAPWVERAVQPLSPAGRWGAWGVATLIISAAGTLASNGLRLLWDLPLEYFAAALRQSYFVGTVIAAVMVIGSRAFALQERRADEAEAERLAAEARSDEAMRLATESQLASLQSRVHPHFLFNTLNSVMELVRSDPGQAIRTLERLSHLFRYSLDREHEPLAPLADEMRIARDYLEIERIRLGSRLAYELEMEPGVERALAPRLTVESLVENAVKYAVASRRGGGRVTVSAVKEEDELVLEVADDGPGFSAEALKEGHGLANLRDRLRALYGGAARLEILAGEPGATVRVTTPLRTVGEEEAG